MNSANNRDRKITPHQEQSWDDPTFNWDDVKEGIFDKVLEEDPTYFDKKEKRRTPLWFIFFGTIFIFSSIAYLFENNKTTPATTPLLNNNQADTIKKHTPIAINPNPTASEANINNLNKPAFANNDNKINNNASFSLNHFNKAENILPEKTPSPINIHAKEDNQFVNSIQNTTINKVHAPAKINVSIIPLEINVQCPKLNSATIVAHNNDMIEGQKHQQSMWKIVATGGPVFSSSKYSGASAAVDLRNNNSSPYFGYQLGIDAWMSLKNDDYLLFGLNNQIIYQNINIYTERQIDTLIQNTLLEVTHYRVGGRSDSTFGDTTIQATEKNRLVNYNAFKSIQFKIGYAKSFKLNKWKISPFVGATTGWLHHSKGRTVAADQSIFAFNKNSSILNRFHLQNFAGIELGRNLSNKTSLLIRYQFDKQWNNASSESEMELRPSLHSFSLGVSTRIK